MSEENIVEKEQMHIINNKLHSAICRDSNGALKYGTHHSIRSYIDTCTGYFKNWESIIKSEFGDESKDIINYFRRNPLK